MKIYIKKMKNLFLILMLVSANFISAQCVLSIGINTASAMMPFTSSTPWEALPCDTTGKWQAFNCLPIKANLSGEYAVYSIDGLVGKTKITTIDTAGNDADCGAILNLSNGFNSTGLIGIKSNWNAIPRKYQTLNSTNATYEQAVKEILVQHSALKNSKIIIQKIVKVDLDGDGKDEVIIHAASTTNTFGAMAGDYSIVFVRRVVNDKVMTEIINFGFVEPNTVVEEAHQIRQFKITSILDLDGDGKMEVLVSDELVDGAGITAYELTNKGLKAVLQWGCGA